MVHRTQGKKQSLRPNTVLTTVDTHLNPNNTHTDHSETIQKAINIVQHYHNVKREGRQTT
jgi:LmbE family N-acetylglucosaminyl deacetylase